MKTTIAILLFFTLLGSQAVLAESEKKTAETSADSAADSSQEKPTGDKAAEEEEPDCD
jgi:hypothetical protein